VSGNNLDSLVIHLVLTHHWFDEMAAGRKDIEYRSTTPHWTRLIWDRRDKITHASFSRGYTAHTITRSVLAVDRGPCPYDTWDDEYFRLHLGPLRDNATNQTRSEAE
jgi:hypothetical protein